MLLRYFQRGFNYSQDGPGNRLVYHLQGCNMTCPWCSNPEGMSSESGHVLLKDADDVIKDILSCRPMFFDGGGVTFTGGEASLQLDTLYYIMSRLKEEGVSCAIETNATHPQLVKLKGVCDYWIMDFKHPSADKLKTVTGGNLDIIEKNIRSVASFYTAHIRIPLIHGFNDDDEALESFLIFFNSLKEENADFDIELLVYHEYGRDKWNKLGFEYTVVGGFVEKQTVDKFANIFKENCLTVIKT